MSKSKFVKAIKRYTPEILASLSCAGVTATAILSSKAGKESTYKIQDDSRDYNDIPIKERVKLCWRCYIPTAIAGTATVVCILSSSLLSRKQQGSLIATYAILEESFKKYRAAANKMFGPDTDKKIQAQIAKDTWIMSNGIVYSDLYSPSETNEEKRLFYSNISNTYFYSTMSSVINAEYHINRNLQLRGNATVSEFCRFLGIDMPKHGDLGWAFDEEWINNYDGFWLDFVNELVTLDDGMECYVIWPSVYPYKMDCEG